MWWLVILDDLLVVKSTTNDNKWLSISKPQCFWENRLSPFFHGHRLGTLTLLILKHAAKPWSHGLWDDRFLSLPRASASVHHQFVGKENDLKPSRSDLDWISGTWMFHPQLEAVFEDWIYPNGHQENGKHCEKSHWIWGNLYGKSPNEQIICKWAMFIHFPWQTVKLPEAIPNFLGRPIWWLATDSPGPLTGKPSCIGALDSFRSL